MKNNELTGNPVKCFSCVHCNAYQDGDGETEFGEMVYTSLSWE